MLFFFLYPDFVLLSFTNKIFNETTLTNQDQDKKKKLQEYSTFFFFAKFFPIRFWWDIFFQCNGHLRESVTHLNGDYYITKFLSFIWRHLWCIEISTIMNFLCLFIFIFFPPYFPTLFFVYSSFLCRKT